MKEEKITEEEREKESGEKKIMEGSSDPSTVDSTDVVNGSEAREEPKNGFLPLTKTDVPRTVGTNSTASQTQLTIFYGGKVCVFDGVSPEKVQEIMAMASAAASAVTASTHTKVDNGGGVPSVVELVVASSPVFTRCSSIQSTTAPVPADPPLTTTTNESNGVAPPSPPAVAPSPVFRRCLTMHSTTDVHLPSTNTMGIGGVNGAAVGASPELTRCSSMQSTGAVVPPPSQAHASSISKLQAELPIARRASLFCFLEKRRCRLVNKGPYPPPTAKPAAAAADEANDNKITNKSTGDASA